MGTMEREISAAVFYLKKMVENAGKLEPQRMELFTGRLAVVLQQKFTGHWYPRDPSKGQAYRCIRVNPFQREEPVILQACRESGLHYSDLRLPAEFTLWVDPGEVCCRFWEHNLSFTVATFSIQNEESNGEASPSSLDISRKCCASQVLNPLAPEWSP